MKCGKGHDHGSVAEVRECYAVVVGPNGKSTPADRKPTEKQVRFLRVLLSKNRAHLTEGREPEDLLLSQARPLIDGLLDREARGYIGSLPEGTKARPSAMSDSRRVRTVGALVPQGYYATRSLTGAQDFDFWFVRVFESGYRRVRRYLGGQGPVGVPRSVQAEALKAIAAEGVDLCGNRFADELGQCRDCGRDLTDKTSRALRRGPVCRAK